MAVSKGLGKRVDGGQQRVKGILSGGATSDPMKIQQNDDMGPTFRSCTTNVSCNISATTTLNHVFDGVLERPDP